MVLRYESCEMPVTTEIVQKVSFRQTLSDFGNVFKAFIGSNYLTISFAFKQSGLILGIIGLGVIAILTDLCCHIIVKCKYAAMTKVVKLLGEMSSISGESMDEDESEALCHRIVNSLQYGDIGMIAVGRAGRIVVNIFIILTQFGFCVSYFIFIGNTVVTIFACQIHPPFPINSSTTPHVHRLDLPHPDLYSPPHSQYDNQSSHPNMLALDNTTTKKPEPKPNPWANVVKAATTCLPPLAVMVLIPLPLFIGFSLIRHLRQLGIISILADIAIFGGVICLLVYLSITFTLVPFQLASWSTFPIFVGAVTSAYEGIGTVIPIESSMEGNRKNFPMFLHIAILGLSCLLAVLGIMGYLQFGDHVEQMLNLNIPMTTSTLVIVSKFIDTTLCIGILLTFPLQVFPIIELLETYLFTEGAPLGPKKDRAMSAASTAPVDEDSTLINSYQDTSALGFNIAVEIPRCVPAWKRNILRVVIVCMCAGVGVACRNIYAYVGAFIGAVGSTMLAFVLPCIFQIALCYSDMSVIYIVRNIAIVIFGLTAGIVSVYSIISRLTGSL